MCSPLRPLGRAVDSAGITGPAAVSGLSERIIDTNLKAALRLTRRPVRLRPRWGVPRRREQVASAVAWVISNQASYITRTTVMVDGGLMAFEEIGFEHRRRVLCG